jgi:hypothetical protein
MILISIFEAGRGEVGSSAQDKVEEKSGDKRPEVVIDATEGWSKVEGLFEAYLDDGLGVLVEDFQCQC